VVFSCIKQHVSISACEKLARILHSLPKNQCNLLGGRCCRLAGVPPPPLPACRHVDMPRRWPATLARPHAGFGGGGRVVPALVQAARGRGAATHCWSFLINNFRGGLFCHFTGRGGLFCQKFVTRLQAVFTTVKPIFLSRSGGAAGVDVIMAAPPPPLGPTV
jgi:hypothetical protein